ncbi:hypothetical protein H072_4834 [Dactylellina haptotyla CBS 200.50]|uniref:Choline kinase N-terminal domain-containing protein n=1 Tax=Dactylellina haptotyla (strain CBS 200.50) TaxID=1284197 RepID=S8BP33_DACHA|nr:hypothetical protein H072_4834 [Dactylellina haptotyla CBS 200.50]
MTSLLPGKVEFSDQPSPSASPRTSPRIRPHRASISNVLQAKFRHAGRITAESSPDIPADSAYGSSLADLDLGPCQVEATMNRSRSSKSLSKEGASNSFYEQVRSWYEEQLEKLESGDASTPLGGASSNGPGLESLRKLEAIIESASLEPRPSHFRRRSSRSLKNNSRSLSHAQSLEDFYTTDNERTILQDVPSCEAELDNSKEYSIEFKAEILRLTHTLKIKNWRKVELARGEEIIVSRISGALTNAVYKVTPPQVSHEKASKPVDTPYMSAVDKDSRRPRKPKPLLLRIYGPQVGHLIDRDTELNILRRLAKHKVGPTLLGTFDNGRFEEFFNAITLTREDIRIPDTSRRIGRRVRDLHDHIPLLDSERADGPMVWRNWDKWVGRGEKVMKELQRIKGPEKRLLVTTWEVLREVVEKRYRPWLSERYGGVEGIKKQLIFCHNDTQYGNIMSRSSETEPPTPASKSPALLPINGTQPARQSLIVIDFEYAGANTRGAEFANHFCEWMSDYHCILSPTAHTIHEAHFPSVPEQKNILRAYVESRGIPYVIPTEDSDDPDYKRKRQSQIFTLEGRLPTREEMEAMDKEVDRLVVECRDWRPAVNACWALWGIVQAVIPGLNLTAETTDEGIEGGDDMVSLKSEEDEEVFDYVKYAEQKAMVFWGDMIGLRVVSEEEVKAWSGREDVRSRLKWLPV